ncbi:MAG: hypothetical protein ACREIP_15345, partial [Alphaproteobacteria bacterium]
NRPDHIPEAEWRVRTDLAAFYRLVHHHGMSMPVSAEDHISVDEMGPAIQSRASAAANFRSTFM